MKRNETPPLTPQEIAQALKEPELRVSLSAAQRAQLPASPIGPVMREGWVVMASEVTTRAASDAAFNLEALCIHCDRPVRREAGGHAVHPALAIATDDTGYDFRRAVTLCSACLTPAGLDTCQLAAMGRVRDFDGLRFRYRLVGTAAQRATLRAFIDVLDFLTADLAPPGASAA